MSRSLIAPKAPLQIRARDHRRRANGRTCPRTLEPSLSAAATDESAERNRRRRGCAAAELANGATRASSCRQADTRTGAESPSGRRRSNRNYIGRILRLLLLGARPSSMVNRKMRLAGCARAVALGCCLAQTPEPPKYTGPGSCASPSCHGGVQVRTETSVQQNEYSTWVVQDKHAHAFAVLTNPVATRMAKILGIDKADTAPKCLACHALSVPEAERARTFDSTDGVSCESATGPLRTGWVRTPPRAGRMSGRSRPACAICAIPFAAARIASPCHLGTADKAVDHEMIAAGHPDLYFELASFTAAMPRALEGTSRQIPRIDVRMLAAGAGRAIARTVAARRPRMRKGTRGPNSRIWIVSPATTV